MHHRQMEGLASVDEFGDLARGGRVPGAAVVQRIAGENADRPAVEPRKAGDDGAAEAARDLEERALVDHRLDDAPHLVGLLAVARHGGDQAFVAPVRIVPALGARRQIPDRRRQIGQEFARACERLFLAVDGIVDRAGGDLHLVAAELLLGALLAEPVHHRRTGDEHRRVLLHHQRIVAGRQARGAKACDRAEAQRDDGDRGPC